MIPKIHWQFASLDTKKWKITFLCWFFLQHRWSFVCVTKSFFLDAKILFHDNMRFLISQVKKYVEGASVSRHRKGYFTNNNIEAPTAGRTNGLIDFLSSSVRNLLYLFRCQHYWLINEFFSSSKSQFYFLTPLIDDSTSNIFSIPGDDGREAGVISGVPAQMVDRALVANRSQDPLMLRASGQGCLILVKYTARIQPTFIVRTPDHPPSSPV